ncbi:hypothetical protein VP01_4792g1 [Puccinia sorghi]|uniref:Uncharacterized protein n=1 Tax=Puccinia sorghi TaxID=27349 RepID=A0A0L6UML4_9BASI|nr:hypothetical protein VP01_4792g1 [Puccinia sorghi]
MIENLAHMHKQKHIEPDTWTSTKKHTFILITVHKMSLPCDIIDILVALRSIYSKHKREKFDLTLFDTLNQLKITQSMVTSKHSSNNNIKEIINNSFKNQITILKKKTCHSHRTNPSYPLSYNKITQAFERPLNKKYKYLHCKKTCSNACNFGWQLGWRILHVNCMKLSKFSFALQFSKKISFNPFLAPEGTLNTPDFRTLYGFLFVSFLVFPAIVARGILFMESR